MVVQHNLMSMFTNRQLGITTKSQAKTSEKLSSGYRINRAADDAAGLTISENMRRQIRGLDKASNNSQDALSFTQVADGAMGELQGIIHRVRELCVQGANDSNTDTDREAIQQEINALTKEVASITENTEFNTLDVFGRDLECVVTNTAGEILSTENITGSGNQYGLGAILGSNSVSQAGSMNELVIDTAGTWSFTGKPATNTKDAVQTKIMSETGKTSLAYYALRGQSSNSANGVTMLDNPPRARIAHDGGYYEITYTKKLAAYTEEGYKYVKNGVVTDLLAEQDLKGVQPDINTYYQAAWMDFSKAGQDYQVSDLYNQGFTVGSAGMSDYYSVMFTNGTDSYEDDPSKILKVDISGCATVPPQAGQDIVNAIMNKAGSCGLTDDYIQFGSTTTMSNSARLYVLDNRGTDVPTGTFELISRGADGTQISSDTMTRTTDANGDTITYTYHTKDMWIQSGELEDNGIMMEKARLTDANIGLNRVFVGDYDTATASITVCDQALEKVSDARASMGAYMNRFEYSIAIADNTSENVQSSESRIRDTDMADEMVAYSRANILAQAGQSMLAQANQSTEGILRLLS